MEPEEVLDDLLVLLSRRTRDAAEAALGDVTLFGVLVCDRADPAEDFDFLLVLLFLNTLEAAEAALLEVTSAFLAIALFLGGCIRVSDDLDGRCIVKYEESYNRQKSGK